MLSWIPGYVYTNGNEAADGAARNDTLQGAYLYFVKMLYKTTLHQQAHFSQVTRDWGHTSGTKLWERKPRCTHGDPSVMHPS